MTDVEAAVNSVLPVAQSTPARPPGFRLGAGMTDVWDGND